ncbi:hypothetical protein [Pseudomonas sp. McL0111]|uniref:hypothetical protein n=1 Tax=Pseudomonas sp. McL0111 TaxID=3457357 RepID=UPI00403EA15F
MSFTSAFHFATVLVDPDNLAPLIERLKILASMEAHKSMLQFHPGTRVSFDSPSGERPPGTVMQLNCETVKPDATPVGAAEGCDLLNSTPIQQRSASLL